LHGWAIPKPIQVRLPHFSSSHSGAPGHGKLIWTTTPGQTGASNGASNPRIEARNAIARGFIEAEGIPVDDQHALMTSTLTFFEDAFHFNQAGSAMMGVQAAAISEALENSGKPAAS